MKRILLAAYCIGLMLAACGSEAPESKDAAPPRLTAATLGEQRILANAEYLQSAPYAAADRSRGAAQAQVCRACHSLQAGGPTMIGPNLFGMFGKTAGFSPDFDYSEALKMAEFRWTPRALDAWLAEPARFLPGNRMSFFGVQAEADRQALIAYLLAQTDDAAAESGSQ